MLKIARANNLLHLDKVVRERIKLTEEEKNFLSQELTDKIKELYKDENIDSVYLTNYQDLESSKGTLYIVVLLKQGSNQYTYYDTLMKELNSKIAQNNQTGVKVAFNIDFENKYSISAMNSSEVHRVEQLVESTILFDKSGELSKIQKTRKKYDHLYSFHLVDYVPPIDKTITRKLAKIK